MKERRAGDRQQGKLTARLWDQGDNAAFLALGAGEEECMRGAQFSQECL